MMPPDFQNYQEEADYRRRQQEFLVSKYKYQNYLKKKQKERDKKWQEDMAKQAMQP